MLLLRTDDVLFFAADVPCRMCAAVLAVCGSADVCAADGAKRAGLRLRTGGTDRRVSLSVAASKVPSKTFDCRAIASRREPIDFGAGLFHIPDCFNLAQEKRLRIRLAASSRLIGGGLRDSIMGTATHQSGALPCSREIVDVFCNFLRSPPVQVMQD